MANQELAQGEEVRGPCSDLTYYNKETGIFHLHFQKFFEEGEFVDEAYLVGYLGVEEGQVSIQSTVAVYQDGGFHSCVRGGVERKESEGVGSKLYWG